MTRIAQITDTVFAELQHTVSHIFDAYIVFHHVYYCGKRIKFYITFEQESKMVQHVLTSMRLIYFIAESLTSLCVHLLGDIYI